MRAVRRLGISLFAGLAFAVPLAAADHMRVVLDVSTSMQKNDSGRLALLATALLHDLARPNTTLGDSFEVIPFDTDWTGSGSVLPVSKRPPLAAVSGDRARFHDELLHLGYSTNATHYYPGLKRAIDDLTRLPGGTRDVRVVVLVTDGLPGQQFREQEKELIQKELLPLLATHHLRLYVIAFGPEAQGNRDFFDSLVRSPTGTSLGSVFVDLDGSRLLQNMLEIFGRSFGYAPDAHRPLPIAALDLAPGSSRPERVAVVISTPRPQPLSRLKLHPPTGGGDPNLDGSLETAATTEASYALQWLLAPDPGNYRLDTDVLNGAVAVLRPTRLELSVQPIPPAIQTKRVMANKPFPIGLLVKPASGAGDPGPVTLKFREHGERSKKSNQAYEWDKDWRAPVSSGSTVTPDGRIFEIRVEFPPDKEDPSRPYVGNLEAEVYRREALVGSLSGSTAHRIEVHPFLSLVPRPLDFTTATSLGRRGRACAPFQFDLVGDLPHLEKPEYAARAELELADPKQLDRELYQATFTLDGYPIEPAGRPGPHSGDWYRGRTISRDQLLGSHEFCLYTGKPKDGDPAKPLPLILRLTLLESPYDDLQVIEPFTLKALIAPPGVFEKWGVFLLGVLGLLLLLASLWHWRGYPTIPEDLGYALAREDSPLSPRSFAPPPLLARFFALVAERPLVIAGEEKPIAWVRPVDRELYQLRLPKGIELTNGTADSAPSLDRKRRTTIAVRRSYRVAGPRGKYVLRLEYR